MSERRNPRANAMCLQGILDSAFTPRTPERVKELLAVWARASVNALAHGNETRLVLNLQLMKLLVNMELSLS